MYPEGIELLQQRYMSEEESGGEDIVVKCPKWRSGAVSEHDHAD